MESVDEEMDMRREAAIASSASLSHDFKPKTSGPISDSQQSKFQELHKRRLQIKAKSKVQKKTKGKGKSFKKPVECEKSNGPVGDSFSDQSSVNGVGDISSTSTTQHVVQKAPAVKQRTKLYWGLDTRERWERKSNM